ncbi:hypothetical protein HK101_004617, partial [Irineochytrium annulatum]
MAGSLHVCPIEGCDLVTHPFCGTHFGTDESSSQRIYCSLHDPEDAKRVTLVKQPSALRRSNRLNASVNDSSGKTPTPAVAAAIPALKPAVAGPKHVAAAPKPAMARRKKIKAPSLITVAEEGQDVNRAGQAYLSSVSTLLKEKLVKQRKSIGSQPDEGLQWEVASTKSTGRTSATERPRFVSKAPTPAPTPTNSALTAAPTPTTNAPKVAPWAASNATPPTKNASAVKDRAEKSAPKAAPKAPKAQSPLPKLVGGEVRRLAKGKASKIASGAQKLGRDKDDKTGHDWYALGEEAILPGRSSSGSPGSLRSNLDDSLPVSLDDYGFDEANRSRSRVPANTRTNALSRSMYCGDVSSKTSMINQVLDLD